jgi:putative membrane protein
MSLAFVLRVVVIAVALWVATLIVPGVDVLTADTSTQVLTLVAVALIFGLVNEVVKPLVKVVGCPLYVLTLGLFGLVVNALLFLLVGFLAAGVGLPFAVGGFGAAFVGAIVVALVGFVLHVAIPDRYDRR